MILVNLGFLMTKVPRLKSNNILFVFIDLQKKLLNEIDAATKIVANSRALLEVAELLDIPTIVTSQYRKGLGDLEEEIAEKVQHEVIDKTTFSCTLNPAFTKELEKYPMRSVVVTGVETHICVLQTALDLMAQDRKVAVVTDTVAARKEEDHQRGLNRMEKSGAIMVTKEMLIYELLERSDVPAFKKILPLIKK
jgi:nicotinamidase-related amidase